MRSIFGCALALLMLGSAGAMDHGQWGNEPEIAAWFAALMQPDNPQVSCCGQADAYWADGVEVKGTKTYAIITDERDDAKLQRHHVPVGTRIEVPDRKIKWDRGNPTGHVVIFLSYGNEVMCYVMNGGV